jgi:hypothetical protein
MVSAALEPDPRRRNLCDCGEPACVSNMDVLPHCATDKEALECWLLGASCAIYMPEEASIKAEGFTRVGFQ